MNKPPNHPVERPLACYRALATAEGRREQQAFLVEGLRAIRQIQAVQPDALIELLATSKSPSASFLHFEPRILSERHYNSISSVKTPLGPMAVVTLPPDIENDLIPDANRILLLEDVQDPGNVGTLIRTAAAFNFNGVILNDKCADPFSPKAVQASAGAVLALWIRRTRTLVAVATSLKKRNYAVIATDLQGQKNLQLETAQRYALALGNEGNGLSPELCDLADIRLKIPINQNNVQSLNVAACGAICMYLTQGSKNSNH